MSPTGTPSPQSLATPLKSRRSVALLTDDQLSLLRQAFAALYRISGQEVNDERGYEYWAGIHGLPTPMYCQNAHGTPFFLPWHRAYLYFFERALQDQVPEATLPWWDWTTPVSQPGAIPPAYDAQQDAGGQVNPLYSAEVNPAALAQGKAHGLDMAPNTLREPGQAGSPPLPSPQEIQSALAQRDYDHFRGAVEQLHNNVHVWVGGQDGHMGQIPFAAYDPIFWAHHTMIDRLWRLWQLQHPGANPDASLLDQALPPFRMTVKQTLDVTALGYDYASSTSSQSVAGGS
jgi:tyrosinase